MASIVLRCSTSEQSPLCSDVFLCLWQKRRHPPAPLLLLSKSQPLTLGCDLVLGKNLKAGASILLRCSTSEQSPLCSDVFLCLWQKRRHPPAPLLLLSKSQPLTLGCDLVLGKNLKAGASILLRCSKNRQAPSGACQFLPIHASRAPAAQPAHSLEWRGSRSACDRSIRR